MTSRRWAKRGSWERVDVAHDHADAAALLHLVESGRLDELLGRVTLDEVAEAWHCYLRRGADGYRDPDWWAVEFWQGLAFTREDVFRSGLLSLIDQSSLEHLGYVGAGPLECFVGRRRDRLGWIEQQCDQNLAFRIALRNVHCGARLRRRLERAARGPLPQPRRLRRRG